MRHLGLVLVAEVDVDGDRVGTVFYRLLDGGDVDLVVRIGADIGGCGQVHDQSDVLPGTAVGVPDQSLVHDDRGRAPVGDVVHGLPHIVQSGHRAVGDTVIHGDYDRAAGLPVHDPLHANSFSIHIIVSLSVLSARNITAV